MATLDWSWPPAAPGRRARPHRHPARTEAAPPTASVTVLLAEDDPLVRAVAGRVLARGGFIVLHACDGPEAIAVAASHPEIALLISDMRMPGMSGLDLARSLRRARPGLPVLLMSGYTEEGPMAVAAADEFLVKPFPPAELLAAARRAMARRGAAPPGGEEQPAV